MKKRLVFGLLAATLLTTATGCFKNLDENQDCTYDPCAVKAPASEIAALREYLTANGITATEHCSGLFYAVQNGGTGKAPEACSRVAATYKGMLTDGSVFDQSTSAVVFWLNRVVRGWTNGVPLIKEGGRIVLYIPPTLGYGAQERRDDQGVVRIPANFNLVFEVDLVAVE